MHGKIINYDSETEIGIIKGEDNRNYTLSILDCRSIISPKIGFNVNFEPHEDKATDIYVISSEVHPTGHETVSTESTHHPRKEPKTYLPFVLVATVITLIAILIYGELDRRKMEEVQDFYHSQIKKIEILLSSGDCTQAKDEYFHAQETRDKIAKMGFYYSLDSHTKQAHAIEIAECYTNENDFHEAIKILDINTIHDPDYLLRASIIYKKSGDDSMADEAKSMAEKYDTSMN